MHERASSYVEHGNETQWQSPWQSDGTNGAGGSGAQEPQPPQDSGGEPEARDGDGQDSTFILLIILILLSQGKTDDKLLLALLYLLF